MPLHFRALTDYRDATPTSTTNTETMPKSRFLGSIALFHHPRFWPRNGDFSLSDSMSESDVMHLDHNLLSNKML